MNLDLAIIKKELNCLELIFSNCVLKSEFWISGYRL